MQNFDLHRALNQDKERIMHSLEENLPGFVVLPTFPVAPILPPIANIAEAPC